MQIHRAVVTHADVEYEGSVSIDANLLEAANILPYEAVHIWNVTNGSRLVTYALTGERGSGTICVNGAAAHLNRPGDLVILATFADMDPAEARSYTPVVVRVDSDDRQCRTSPRKCLARCSIHATATPSCRHPHRVLRRAGRVGSGDHSRGRSWGESRRTSSVTVMKPCGWSLLDVTKALFVCCTLCFTFGSCSTIEPGSQILLALVTYGENYFYARSKPKVLAAKMVWPRAILFGGRHGGVPPT